MSSTPEFREVVDPEFVDMWPGDRATLVAEDHTVYEIDDVVPAEGLLSSTITRQPAPETEHILQTMVIADAIFAPIDALHESLPFRRIYRDRPLWILGMNRDTGEEVDIKTAKIQSITYYERPPEQT